MSKHDKLILRCHKNIPLQKGCFFPLKQGQALYFSWKFIYFGSRTLALNQAASLHVCYVPSVLKLIATGPCVEVNTVTPPLTSK